METRQRAGLSMSPGFAAIDEKMREAGEGEVARAAFRRAFDLLAAGDDGLIAETGIEPVRDLPSMDAIPQVPADRELLARCAVLKLNGGLGTGMGLEKAKSLLPVRDDLTFLDLIARQVIALRESAGPGLRFLLMNSFSTSADTLAKLREYPELGPAEDTELLQGKVPKLLEESLQPASWPGNPTLEWCPPGHGDLYLSLLAQGRLHQLLDAGIRVLFVSNSDNLGATLDPALLRWFHDSDKSFLMEVTRRTAADRKGGHLALRRSDGRLLLRESAQCPGADEAAFQDIDRHRYFNTNNLWLRLDRLAAALDVHGGVLPLPVIRNRKPLEPRDPASPAVFQLETAMGAAIECFGDATAIEVPRSRFSPVKTTADLLALRSDAYVLREDGCVVLAAERGGVPPEITLDPKYFKFVDSLDVATARGTPSLIACDKLEVIGPVRFAAGVRFEGGTRIENPGNTPAEVPPGTHTGTLRLGG